MTETKQSKPRNFVRDQFIVLMILVVALFCRSSLISSKSTISTEVATPSLAVTTDAVADAR